MVANLRSGTRCRYGHNTVTSGLIGIDADLTERNRGYSECWLREESTRSGQPRKVTRLRFVHVHICSKISSLNPDYG